MPLYPDPNITTSGDMMKHADSLTQNAFLPTVTIAIFIVLFSLLKAKFYRSSASALASTSVTWLLSTMLWAGELLNISVVIIWFAAMLGSVIWVFFDR